MRGCDDPRCSRCAAWRWVWSCWRSARLRAGASAVTGAGAWLLLAGTVLTLALGAGAARLAPPWGSVGLAIAAGVAFAGVGICARVLVVPDPLWQLLAQPVVWSLAGYGVLGMLFFALALQRGAVTTAAAVTFCVETLLPAGIGVALLGDAARPGFELVAFAAFVITLVSAVALARFAEPEPGLQVTGTTH